MIKKKNYAVSNSQDAMFLKIWSNEELKPAKQNSKAVIKLKMNAMLKETHVFKLSKIMIFDHFNTL